MIELRHQCAGFGIGQEIGGCDQFAGIGAKPRERLVIAHLALRQASQLAAGRDQSCWRRWLCDRGNDAVAVKSSKGRDLGFGRGSRHLRRRHRDRGGNYRRPGHGGFGRRCGRRTIHGRRRLDRGHRGGPTLVRESDFMRRHRVGQLLDQRGQFLDFGGERLGGGQRAVDDGIDLASIALSRRPNSANCRARSPEPRARLASWLLASSRSCLRAAIAL